MPAIPSISAPAPPVSARSRRVTTLRALARKRNLLRLLTVALPTAAIVATDLAARGTRLLGLSAGHKGALLLAMLESALFWGSLLTLASRRRGPLRWIAAAVAVFAAAWLVGGQRYFFDQYVTYLNADAAAFGASVGRSVVNQVAADAGNFLRFLLPPAALMAVLIVAARRLAAPRRTHALAASIAWPVTLVLALVVPWSIRKAQAATPDVIFLHALGRVAAMHAGVSKAQWVKPAARKPDYLPALSAAPTRPRNVLLVLTESERHDVVCSARDGDCRSSPHSDAAAPSRFPLRQLRSVASTTAISEMVLWSGVSPVESAEALRTSPMLWDYAHAAGWETSYTTSQNLDFANAREFLKELPLKHRADAVDLNASSDQDIGAPDELATRLGLEHIADLREPFYAVVHHSNTHFPYRIDLAHAPFQPCDDTKDPERTPELFSYYRNSVYLSDRAVGDLVRGVRALPSGARTVIVFTSDHGEAFREHGQLGHTNSVLDEELHVPGWIDAPPGTLGDEEAAALRAASDAYVTHLDLAPTMLDLMGLWDAPELARHRARMIGRSLLRPLRETAVPLTNCAAVWGCPFRNWGMLRGPMKLEARQWDPDWHCFDLRTDPREQHDLGAAACGDLAPTAAKLFGRKPWE